MLSKSWQCLHLFVDIFFYRLVSSPLCSEATCVVRRRLSSDRCTFRSLYPATVNAPSWIHPRPINSVKNGNNAKKSPHVQSSGHDGQYTVRRETAHAAVMHPIRTLDHPVLIFRCLKSSSFPETQTRVTTTSQLYFHIRAENSSTQVWWSSIFAFLYSMDDCFIVFSVFELAGAENRLPVKERNRATHTSHRYQVLGIKKENCSKTISS